MASAPVHTHVKGTVHAQIVKVSEVFHHPEYNAARPSGDYGSEAENKKTLASMVREGWRMNGDGVLEVTKISQEWADRAVQSLSEDWEALKTKAKEDPKQLAALHVFETNRVSKGKIIVPKYMGVSGNRRNRLLAEANLARYTAEPSLPLITEYPVIIREFENDMERIIAQMLENTGKLEGFSKPSEKDMILCAEMILAKGGLQTDIRRAFGDTTGQKLYGILTLDKRFPKAKLKKRIVDTDPADPKFIRYGAIKGAKLPNLVLRSDPADLAKANLKERTAGRQEMVPLTEESLEEFLGTPTVNEPKIMERKNIAALQTQNTNTIVQSVAKAIMLNNSDPLNKYIVHAPVYNVVETLCDKGIGPDLETILLGLAKAQDIAVAVKSVKHALKV